MSTLPNAHRAALWIYQQQRQISVRDIQRGLAITEHQAKAAMRRILEQADNWFGREGYSTTVLAPPGCRPSLHLTIHCAPRLPSTTTLTELIADDIRRNPGLDNASLCAKYQCSRTLVCEIRQVVNGQRKRRKRGSSRSRPSREHQAAIDTHRKFLQLWPRHDPHDDQ